MKKTLLLGLLLSFNLHAEDVAFKIDQFNMVGDQGRLISKEFTIISDTGQIGFKSNGEDFDGEVTLRDKVMLIQGTNGMFIKAEAPVNIKSIPETSITNATFINQKELLSLEAQALSTSVSNFHIDTQNLNFRCVDGAQCQASASFLVWDRNLKIVSPTFVCQKDHCIDNFTLTVNQLSNDLKFFARNNLETKSIIELEDLSSITFVKGGNNLDFTGKVKIPLFGRVDFLVKGVIVNLTKERMDISLRKVKVGKYLSVTDLTLFLAKKLLGGKSFNISGDVISINLK